MPKLKVAEYALPRRVRDRELEEFIIDSCQDQVDLNPRIYRMVHPDDKDRGELYPICKDFNMISHFGLGTGIYFLQLLIMAGICLVSGLLYIPAFRDDRRIHIDSKYDEKYSTIFLNLLKMSSVCKITQTFTTSVNCPNGQAACSVSERQGCHLNAFTVFGSIAMSVLFIAAIFISKYYIEERMKLKFTDAAQRTQDYTVQINNPPPDADNPDEWQDLFNHQFGFVRYVTVVKRNYSLVKLLIRKLDILRHIKELENASDKTHRHHNEIYHNHYRCGFVPCIDRIKDCLTRKIESLDYYQNQLQILDQKLDEAFKTKPSVAKVFITFEKKADCRKCMTDYYVGEGVLFRELKLNFDRPAEPDCMIWPNVEISSYYHYFMAILSYCLTGALLIGSFVYVHYVRTHFFNYVAIIITVTDLLLPPLLMLITMIERNIDEDVRHVSLQKKLFIGRFLTSVLYPYIVTDWNKFLNESNVATVISTQIGICFTSSVFHFLDIRGVLMRHIVAPLISITQPGLNMMWQGTPWNLAERYTNISKMMFICMFYSFLTPVSMLIGVVAFIILFWVDRFLLLRRWQHKPMLNCDIGEELRRQLLVCVASHMYATFRFIYSWPMDTVYIDHYGVRDEYMNKNPPWLIWRWNLEPTAWMTRRQHALAVFYLFATTIVIAFTIYYWFIEDFLDTFRSLRCRIEQMNRKAESKIPNERSSITQTRNSFSTPYSYPSDKSDSGSNPAVIGADVPFSHLTYADAYVPYYRFRGEVFYAADMKEMIPMHLPRFLSATPGKDHKYAIVKLVPDEIREKILSKIKWYGAKPSETRIHYRAHRIAADLVVNFTSMMKNIFFQNSMPPPV